MDLKVDVARVGFAGIAVIGRHGAMKCQALDVLLDRIVLVAAQTSECAQDSFAN